jgi:hypothetical protein
MQERSDEFDAFVDGAGRRWRVARAFAGPLRRALSGWVESDAPPPVAAAVVELKRSSRRDVWALTADGAPPLVLKRFPPRSGLFGRARDPSRRARSGVPHARRLIERGLAVARPLAVVDGGGPRRRRLRVDASSARSARDDPRAALRGRRPFGGEVRSRAGPLDLLQAVHGAGFWHRDFHGGNPPAAREAEAGGHRST